MVGEQDAGAGGTAEQDAQQKQLERIATSASTITVKNAPKVSGGVQSEDEKV